MTLLLEVRAHASWVRSTIDLVVVTAADRAAATCQLLPFKERKLVLINKKEVILTVVEVDQTDAILSAIERAAELDSPGMGIAFVINLEKIAGRVHMTCGRPDKPS